MVRAMFKIMWLPLIKIRSRSAKESYVYISYIMTYSVTEFVLKEADEPIKRKECCFKVQLDEMLMDLWQYCFEKLFPEVFNIRMHSNHLCVVINREHLLH